MSAGEAAQPDGADGDPGQPFDVQMKIRGHSADFPVFPLGKNKIVMSRTGLADRFGAQTVAFGRHAGSGQLPHCRRGQFAGKCDPVSLFHFISRMSQTGHEIAVVGKEDQSFAVLVQSSGGNQPGLPGLRNEVDRFPGGMAVLQRADVASGFVQHDIQFFPRRSDGPAVEFHPVAGLDPHGAAFRRNAVDLDPAGGDQRFCTASGADSRRAQIFGQRYFVRFHWTGRKTVSGYGSGSRILSHRFFPV